MCEKVLGADENYCKRLLRKYKYPPDKQATAVDLIIEQAEKMCESELDK